MVGKSQKNLFYVDRIVFRLLPRNVNISGGMRIAVKSPLKKVLLLFVFSKYTMYYDN